MSTDKKTIKELLKQEDAFLSNTEKTYDYVVKNKKLVIAVAVIVLLLFFIVAYVITSQDTKHNEQILEYEKASSAKIDKGYDLVIDELTKLQTKNPSKTNKLIDLDLIGLKVLNEQEDFAVQEAKVLLTKLNPKDPMRVLLINNMATYYENFGFAENNKEAYQEAYIYYKENLDKAESDVFKIDLNISLARVSLALGENQEAVNYLENVVLNYIYNQEAQVAVYYLAKIKKEYPELRYASANDPIINEVVEETAEIAKEAIPEASDEGLTEAEKQTK